MGYPRQDDSGRPDTGWLQETEDTTGVNHAPVAAAKAVDSEVLEDMPCIEALTAGCGVERVMAGRAGASDDCG